MVNHYAHVGGIDNPVTIITRKRFSGDAVDSEESTSSWILQTPAHSCEHEKTFARIVLDGYNSGCIKYILYYH